MYSRSLVTLVLPMKKVMQGPPPPPHTHTSFVFEGKGVGI